MKSRIIERMKPLGATLIIMVFCLLGCASRPPEESSMQIKDPVVLAIADSLKTVPVPFPETTPYDADARKRETYLSGFKDGWNDVISGVFLYGDRGSPTSLPADLYDFWDKGWKAGTELGFQRWSAERIRVVRELTEQRSPASNELPQVSR